MSAYSYGVIYLLLFAEAYSPALSLEIQRAARLSLIVSAITIRRAEYRFLALNSRLRLSMTRNRGRRGHDFDLIVASEIVNGRGRREGSRLRGQSATTNVWIVSSGTSSLQLAESAKIEVW